MTRRHLLLAIMLILAGPAAGSEPEPDGYRLQDYRGPVPATVRGAAVLHAAQVETLAKQGALVLIDVLPAPRQPPGMRPGTPWLPVPHRDLPGSIWWPDVGRGALSPEFEAQFRARVLAQSAAHPGSQIVFYCLDQCWLSWNAAKRAATYGVPVGWFPEGADGWQASGLPTQEATPEFLD